MVQHSWVNKNLFGVNGIRTLLPHCYLPACWLLLLIASMSREAEVPALSLTGTWATYKGTWQFSLHEWLTVISCLLPTVPKGAEELIQVWGKLLKVGYNCINRECIKVSNGVWPVIHSIPRVDDWIYLTEQMHRWQALLLLQLLHSLLQVLHPFKELFLFSSLPGKFSVVISLLTRLLHRKCFQAEYMLHSGFFCSLAIRLRKCCLYSIWYPTKLLRGNCEASSLCIS